MQIGWVYAFCDRGFDRGVKIGRDKNHPDRFKRAQCYTPRGIDLVAVWPIDDRFSSLAEAESLARQGLPNVSGSNNGAEWCDATPAEAIATVTENLGVDPERTSRNPAINATYDDFRDPKKLGRETHRQIIWVYVENVTSILKVQRTSSWKVPQEPVKTYSLLGFRPVTCFGNFGEPDLRRGNSHIHNLWVNLVNTLGHGVDHLQVGWLRPEAQLNEIRQKARAHGLAEMTDWSVCPSGVRSGY